LVAARLKQDYWFIGVSIGIVYFESQQRRIYMKIAALTIGFLLIASIALAADIDGKWTGSVAGMDGNPMTINYTFKAEGNTLTGSTTGMDGKDVAIKNGKIDGNNVSYTVSFSEEFKMDFKGVLSGDTLKLSMDMMGQPTEIVLKKAK
jgi:hypothetical protein